MTAATGSRVLASDEPGEGRQPKQPGRAGRSGAGWHRAGFWLVAYAFTVTMAFSAVPTPLYVLYQARDGFGSFTLTLIFAAYAVGVALALLLAGHLSDWAGRRRMLAVAIAVNVVSGVLFLTWPTVPGLLVARFVSGVSIGLLTATATAHLTELHRAGLRRSSGPGGPGGGRTRCRRRPTWAESGSARCWPGCWPSTRRTRCTCPTTWSRG